MSKFTTHKVTATQLLGVIPEGLLSHLSTHTAVDYCSKVLHGKKMFYLLLYGILENDRLSQRTLEDTFNDSVFKTLFQLDAQERICRSSISERLSKIDADYFRQIYDCVYGQFCTAYSVSERQTYNLIRVDSSMVYEASSKLLEGIDYKNGKKAVKYSITFDGILPCGVQTFTSPAYASEDVALPEVIRTHVKHDSDHRNIYVIDRGLQSSRTMRELDKESTMFIVRAKENRKYVELESLLTDQTDLETLTLVKDSKVYLYSGVRINNKRGNVHYREELVEHPLRLIVAHAKEDTAQQYWFITNEFEISPKEITDAYRRRWDIEVFFRFIKQELNVSHLVSLNRNGIQVTLYMMLIVAMLVLIYKHANKISYKTAKRRFAMEIRDLAIAMIVLQCGGDPAIVFKT
uniref:IS4 family transposase n=1 Tax=Alistipes sp. D31t1_170403_E11 TaxID=2787128 RepID=UPI00189AF9D0|nr:IS4 family transposase [Alistipes sp. D31t1_170403_E11]